MSDIQFNLVKRDGRANLTYVVDGNLYPVDDSHARFDEIVDAVVDGDAETAVALYDLTAAVAESFENLSDRVKVANSRVYVDQTEVDDVYADQIVRFLEDGVADWQPLVNFLEKVYSNVSEGIRENLSRWLQAEQFTILPNGNILGYRGLRSDHTSVHAGPGIVNGERVNGHLDNTPGNVVEIDTDKVEVDARRGCASGLHVGTFSYAQGWSQGALVSVEVDPRHVRSVPFECGSNKMRVSKFRVLEDVSAKHAASVDYSDYDSGDYNEYDYDGEEDWTY
jgi:hypothetical protein